MIKLSSSAASKTKTFETHEIEKQLLIRILSTERMDGISKIKMALQAGLHWWTPRPSGRTQSSLKMGTFVF